MMRLRRPPPEQPTKRTVEFRQHEGTLNATHVKMWAVFCVAVLEFIKRTDERLLRDLCRNEIWRQTIPSDTEIPTSPGEYSYLADVCRVIRYEQGGILWNGLQGG